MNRLEAIVSCTHHLYPTFDIGCDHGYIGLSCLLKSQSHVTFVDASQHVINRLAERQMVSDFKGRCRLRTTRAEHLKCPEKPHNIIFAGVGFLPIKRLLSAWRSSPQFFQHRYILGAQTHAGYLERLLDDVGLDLIHIREIQEGQRTRRIVVAENACAA